MRASHLRTLAITTMTTIIAAFPVVALSQQADPNRPVRIVAPFPPGNAADVVSRAMSDRLQQRLGQPMVIDNRVGGSGIIGVDSVAKAPPDGYTLLVTSLSPVTLLPAVFKTLPYDVERDFIPVALIGFTSMILVTAPTLPVNSVTELVALAKANPGKYNYAHIGLGTISHLTMESLKLAMAVDIVGVPYKGSAQATTDLLGGQINLMFDGMTSAGTQVRAGKLKALAVTSQKRSPFAPGVATMGDAGVAAMHDLNMIAWVGMFAPAGTPRAIIDRWHKEVSEIAVTPDVRERLAAVSTEPAPLESPAKFAEFHRNELTKWAKIAQSAGVFRSQ